ncbi:MAG TPA: Gfo/Idh/MocA family oxidoreductase [Vicinamibacteria bacterium]|nr:Gfo/Idh/MocA family oxidoreductase [Vicinamibacteria bacterium]
MTRVAVVGVGALGQHHARVYASLPGASLAGVFDIDARRGGEVAARHGCRVLGHLRDVVASADAVSVAVPTVDHHRVARALLEAGKDVLVEKPMTKTVEEADDLIRLAEARGAVLQVGHIERFNPAVDVLRAEVRAPRFIEVHRLAPPTPRSLDIDVVLDLMIHDLDILLSLDGSEAVQIDAVGVPVLSDKIDIANARLRFASGLIANLTASRVSAEKVRKFRVFAPRTYISADFSAREAQVYRLLEVEGRPDIAVGKGGAPEEEPLQRQLAGFLEAVRTRGRPVVSGADGRRALALAHAILARMTPA